MRSTSLRLRVTLSVTTVLTVVVAALMVVIYALFNDQMVRENASIIADRVQVARKLEKRALSAYELYGKLAMGSVLVQITEPDGTTIGPGLDRAAPVPAPQAFTTSDGTTITVFADAWAKPEAELRSLLIVAGLGAILVTAVMLVFTARFALKPLTTMANLARSTANGDRGRRLRPHRRDTELGRTAAAFDDMLDALEGAEARSRMSEERTRQFVADAAHELRTPIAGVQAVAESMLQHSPDTDLAERDRMLLLLVRESRRGGRLVNDLLSLARIDAGLDLRRQSVQLRSLAEVEADRIRVLAPNMVVEVRGAPVEVTGDAQRLTQVLANLMNNARQATREHGRIIAELDIVDQYVHLLVTDDGPGVPEEDRNRIFDRLVRLDEARARTSGGSGLGLAIARGICRAHGGDLRCESPRELTGAAFRIVLPLSTNPA